VVEHERRWHGVRSEEDALEDSARSSKYFKSESSDSEDDMMLEIGSLEE